MNQKSATQMVTAICLAQNRDIDPALARVWHAVLTEIPDEDVPQLTAELLREHKWLPAPSEVLAAWREMTTLRRSSQARAAFEASTDDPYLAMPDDEYDRIAIPPPPEALAAMKRLGLPVPKEAA